MFLFLFKWEIILQTTPPPWTWFKGPASCSFFLSISVNVSEVSMSGREGRSGELHGVDPFWLHRLIIIKTHTTWHVYLMAAPGKDGKLLLSLTVTCWSTTAPRVRELPGINLCRIKIPALLREQRTSGAFRSAIWCSDQVDWSDCFIFTLDLAAAERGTDLWTNRPCWVNTPRRRRPAALLIHGKPEFLYVVGGWRY